MPERDVRLVQLPAQVDELAAPQRGEVYEAQVEVFHDAAVLVHFVDEREHFGLQRLGLRRVRRRARGAAGVGGHALRGVRFQQFDGQIATLVHERRHERADDRQQRVSLFETEYFHVFRPRKRLRTCVRGATALALLARVSARRVRSRLAPKDANVAAKKVERIGAAEADGERAPSPTHFVIVTGLSGAGKSQAAKCLEDLGYFCVDNLPPSLIPKFAELCSTSRSLHKVALVLDIRGEEIFGDLIDQLRILDRERILYRVIFLDAADDVLVRRFSETRRKHPLSDRGRLIDSIIAEREELKPIRDVADVIVDTSGLTLSVLKEKLGHAVAGEMQVQSMTASVVAFGFKYGIPLDADMVFDVRFLPNPNYVDELRTLSGSHPAVVAFLEADEEVQAFKRELFRFVDYLVPRFVREGKAHLTIAIGCTGGRHRSVYFANELAAHLRTEHVQAFVGHRDVGR